MNINKRFWYVWAGLMTLLGGIALWLDGVPGTIVLTPPWVLLMWLLPWVGIRQASRGATGERTRGVVFAYVLVLVFVILNLLGLMLFQPMRANPPGLGYVFHTLASVWLFTFLVGFNSDDGRLRTFGRKVSESRLLSSLLVLVVFTILSVTAAEYALRFLVVQSFGANPSIVMRNYLSLTWGETNSLGIRDDREPIPPDDPNVKTLVVLGDSVAAGFGINDREGRMSNQLQAHLGEDYAVYLLALPGWETQTQLAQLQNYPVTPDILVVSYFPNDINEAYYDKHGHPEPYAFDGETIFVRQLFIPSLIYWKWWVPNQIYPRLSIDPQSDPDVLAAHADEIRELVGWARDQGTTVIFVVWSNPVIMEHHAPLLNVVSATLDELDVPHVDMMSLMEPYPVIERVASVYDSHPNAKMHQVAADALLDVMTEAGLIEAN